MKPAAIYCRVSSQEQAERGLSIIAQKNALYDYARKNDMQIVAEYIDEGESAFRKRGERTQFQEMIAAARKKPRPFDVILVHKWDRFARSREDSVVYKKLLRRDCGIEIISITEPIEDGPTGVLMEGMLELLAEFYSLNLSQEVKKGQHEATAQGKVFGHPPLGYRFRDGQCIVIPEEAEQVRRIFERYASGEYSIRRLAITERKAHSAIRRILKRTAYKGEFRRGGDVIPVPAIVPADIFDRVQEMLRKQRVYRSSPESTDYLLRGLVKCLDCGAGMSQTIKRKRKFLRCTTYARFGSAYCYYNAVRMDILEEAILDKLKVIMGGQSFDNIEVTFTEDAAARKEYESLVRSLDAIPRKLERLVVAYENEAIDLETLKESRERLERERAELEKKINAVRKRLEGDWTARQNEVRETIERVLTTLDNPALSIAERRLCLGRVIDSVGYSRRRDLLVIRLKV